MSAHENLVAYLYTRVEALESRIKELEEEIQSLKNN